MDFSCSCKAQRGFTLIEVMIVIVLIAILAGIAVPSYRSHICKTERSVVKGDLLSYAQALESYFTANNFSYEDTSNTDNLPDVYSNYSPADGSASKKDYDLALSVTNNGKSFTLTATRSQASCQDGTFTLNQAGMRTWTRDGVTQNDWDE